VKPIVLLPVPLELDVIVSHGTWLVAVQAQPAGVVSVMGAEAPAVAGTVLADGVNEKLQPLPWLTVSVWPAMRAVPVRGDPGFAAMLSVTGAVPDPVAPEATVIHTAWEIAVHAQPAGAVTVTVWLPPAAVGAVVAGVIANVHGTGPGGVTPAWATVMTCAPIVIVSTRGRPVLAGTRNEIEALSLPLPVSIVIQLAFVVAVQAQPLKVVTLIVAVPPASGSE
jgi:hypothetical protein